MEDRDKILDYTKPFRLPDDCSKNRKNFTQGYYYREIGRYKNVVPSEFQLAAEDKLVNKSTFEEFTCQLPDTPRSTFLMVFSPDGKKVASTHGNHKVYVTDLTTGKLIQTLSGHPRTPWCIAFHPSSNQILASGCLGGQVRVWDLNGGSEVWTAESQTVIASLAFHPIDRMLVIATYNELYFWDWSQPEPFARCSTKSGREKVRYVSFDRLGNKLITGIANPVSVPSQWDRINVASSQPPVTSNASTVNTPSCTINSTSSVSTSTVSSQSNEPGRSITSWYRASFNRYNHLISISRNTPTIDRGTDPMDLLDLRSNRNNSSDGSTSSPSPSTSNLQSNPLVPLRFKISRSTCRTYRPLSFHERWQIHSSVFGRLSRRSSLFSNSTASSTSVSHSSVFTSPSFSSPITTSSRVTYIPRLRPCTFSSSSISQPWWLTLIPENLTSLLSTTTSQSTMPTGAVTNTTFTSYPDRGIFSTRETSSSNSDRTRFSSVRPYRSSFDNISDDHTLSQRDTQSEPERDSGHELGSDLFHNSELSGSRTTLRNNLMPDSPESGRSSSRDLGMHYSESEIDRELRSSASEFRRQETESSDSNRESPYNNELPRSNRSIFQLIPVNLRNLCPVRRFRGDANSGGESTETSRAESQPLSQSLMHPRPLPRFQMRSRLSQDQRSQLHLLTNRETHGLNLQNNQNLRRQLSFRPGGQFVLSRHSNSPFQPRVPHHSDTLTPSSLTPKSNDSRPEISPHRSSCNTSASSNASEAGTSASTSTGNTFSLSSVASNLSFTGEGSSHQLPDQINRRLFDRVNMMLRDRIRNSSEYASTDSTVNYSRISGEAEIDLMDCEENLATRGLGPRGEDPMLSSVSNLVSANELLLDSGSSSPISGNVNSIPSSNNSLNSAQPDLLDPWETETDSTPYSLSVPLPLSDDFNGQSQATQESTRIEPEIAESNQGPLASNNGGIDNSIPSSLEFSMRQGIQLLSLHIENMQRLCWARIEILQLQKIRRMWEDLTTQIRQFHNIIQNRTPGENSASVESTEANSGSDILNMRNLAIRSSPIPDRNSEFSSSSETPNACSRDLYRKNHVEQLSETKSTESIGEGRSSNFSHNYASSSFQKFKSFSSEKNASQSQPRAEKNESSSSKPIKSETEEPQPGPSGLSAPSTSSGVRNSILRLEYRVYKLLRDIIQITRRRREVRDSGMSSSSQRSHQSLGGRNSLSSKFRNLRYSRLDSSISRSRALSRELDAIWRTRRNEKSTNIQNHSGDSNSNEPSTSFSKTSVPNDACQSCGQKKKPVKGFSRPKRNLDPSSSSTPSEPSSKIFRNNMGERREASNAESKEEGETSGASSSQTQENSANDLLKQMLQIMETMLDFQREAFQNSRGVTKQRSAPESSGEDSDGDQNDSNEQGRELPNYAQRSEARELVNSVHDVAQLRAKRLLGFMVKSLNQFFGKNFKNLSKVLDEEIFSLYMLLDLALELTDLLLEQLNARSRDLERNCTVEQGSRQRSWRGSKLSSSDRNRERNRSYPPLNSNREDSRARFCINPYLGSGVGSTGTSNVNHERFCGRTFLNNCRRKIATARMSTAGLPRCFYRRGRIPSQTTSSSNLGSLNRPLGGNSLSSRYRNFCSEGRLNNESSFGSRGVGHEINNNRNNNDTNNNYSSTDDRNFNGRINNNYNSSSNNISNNSGNNTSNNSSNDNVSNNTNIDNRGTIGTNSSSDISNNNNSFSNYYFSNGGNSNGNSEISNIIIVAGLSNSSDNRNNVNSSTSSGSNSSFLNQNSLPPLRSMELTLSRNESGDLSLRDERPIFWIRYGGNNETSAPTNNRESQPRVSGFTLPIVQVNNVPVSDVSMLNQPRHRPQSPVPRVSEDVWRWRALRPRFLHPRYGGLNPFDDPDSNDVPENIPYYRAISVTGSGLGVYTLDPMTITDAPMSPHHRIQAWDFSKMNIPDISDREANGVVAECKIHNDASVDVSNDGHLLVTLLPSGRSSVTTTLGVYSLDWSSLGQLLYRTSFEQNAVSVSLSPTNRHLVVGLASRPVVLRDRINMAQIFRLEGGRPSPHGGSWQSGRGRLVHIRDLEQTRGMNIMSVNCIRWAPGAGQGLVYGTNTGELKVMR